MFLEKLDLDPGTIRVRVAGVIWRVQPEKAERVLGTNELVYRICPQNMIQPGICLLESVLVQLDTIRFDIRVLSAGVRKEKKSLQIAFFQANQQYWGAGTAGNRE